MFFLLLISLIANFTLAIGITPAEKVINFVGKENTSVTLNIYNNEKKDFNVLISLKGKLEKYSKTKDILLELNQNEQYKPFTIDLELPDNIEAGVHETQVIAVEFPKETSKEEAFNIQALPSVIAKLKLRVPYPSKYAESKLIVEKFNGHVKFTMPIFNYGSEKIEDVFGTLQIYYHNQNITEIKTNEISLDIQKQGLLSASWDVNVIDLIPGTYTVMGLIDYDGNILKLEQEFYVGEPFIEIKSISIGNFIPGDIARIDVELENKWDKVISMTGVIGIRDENNNLITTIDIGHIELEPSSSKKIKAFWDTKGVAQGYYNAELTINYLGSKSKKYIPIDVGDEEILHYKKSTTSLKSQYLITLIFIIILIGISWFVFKRLERM